MTRLPHLFSPLSLRGRVLGNRIASTAHGTGLTDASHVGDALIAYYESRARGGVALAITGSTSVHPSSCSKLAPALHCWDDGAIPALARLAEAVHPHGTVMLVQLNHADALSGSGGPFGSVVGPSEMDAELAVEPARPITEEEMTQIVDAFAAAALRVRAAGLDGVEIHGGHGNLIQQFLSPHSNRRTDRWGGDIEARMRFPLRILRSVREAVGSDTIVGLRLCAEEEFSDGLDLEQARVIAPQLVAAGDVDYLNVTSGSDLSWHSLPRHYGPMYLPGAHMRGLARAMKGVVDVPVLCVGRITDPRDGEDILASGDADLIGMTRALIADRDLPEKARRGDLDAVRYCVGANEGCLGRLFGHRSITCIQDPTAGREHEIGPPTPAGRSVRVVVVGAGVAGMEAARVAALRGHQVVLLEAQDEVGGQLRLARRASGREEIGAVADNLSRAIARLDVDLKLRTAATVESVAALDPQAVIVATGSTAWLPMALDDGYDRLVSPRAALDGAMLGDPLLVWDTRGDITALSVADHLARIGHRVIFATRHESPGPLVDLITRRMVLERLAGQGVDRLTNVVVTRLTPEGIEVCDRIAGTRRLLEGHASLVACTGARPRDDLHAALRDALPGSRLALVGDARDAGNIESAIASAHHVARSL